MDILTSISNLIITFKCMTVEHMYIEDLHPVLPNPITDRKFNFSLQIYFSLNLDIYHIYQF